MMFLGFFLAGMLGSWKIINPQSYLSFRPYSVLMPTANILICTVGVSTEYELRSGVIFVDLFLYMALKTGWKGAFR